MSKHVISPARRVSSPAGRLLHLELDLPEIAIELPTPSEMARSTASLVAERLRESIKAGKDANGNALRTPSGSTIRRRAADTKPPRKPRTSRWRERYSGQHSMSHTPAVDSGMLWRRIRLAAAGAGSAEVHAPPERPMRDIEQRLGATIFAATPRMLEDATDAIMAPVFSGWSGASSGARAAVRRSVK